MMYHRFSVFWLRSSETRPYAMLNQGVSPGFKNINRSPHLMRAKQNVCMQVQVCTAAKRASKEFIWFTLGNSWQTSQCFTGSGANEPFTCLSTSRQTRGIFDLLTNIWEGIRKTKTTDATKSSSSLIVFEEQLWQTEEHIPCRIRDQDLNPRSNLYIY